MTGQIFKTGFIGALRDGAWASPARVTGYLRLFAAANLLGLAFAICLAHGWGLPAEPHLATEFMSFYAAGRLVDAGQAAAVYLPAGPLAGYNHSYALPGAFSAIQQTLSGDPHIALLSFFYPPVFWLIAAPLAHLGFYPAYAVWDAIGLAAYLALIRCLLGSWRYIWAAAAYLPIVKNAAVGENAFISASLIGFGLLTLPARPWLAGALFGGLCFKPHFLLPVGIMLLAGRQWRALAATCLSAAALCTLAGGLFGWPTWRDYFTVVVPHAQWMFAHHGFSYALQVTPFSAIRMLGGPIWAGNAAQTATGLFTAGMIIAARRTAPDIQAAILCAGFALLASVMLDYDLCITGLAILFLLRAARTDGFLPFEKTAAAALFLLPFIVLSLRQRLHVPADPLIEIAFLIVMAGRLRPRVPA